MCRALLLTRDARNDYMSVAEESPSDAYIIEVTFKYPQF